MVYKWDFCFWSLSHLTKLGETNHLFPLLHLYSYGSYLRKLGRRRSSYTWWFNDDCDKNWGDMLFPLCISDWIPTPNSSDNFSQTWTTLSFTLTKSVSSNFKECLGTYGYNLEWTDKSSRWGSLRCFAKSGNLRSWKFLLVSSAIWGGWSLLS